MLAAVLTALLFSVSVVCATQSSKLLGGTEANFWRLTIATAFLALWAYTYGQGTSGAAFQWFLVSGIVGVGADVFLFQALPRIGSRLSLLIIQCFSALSGAVVEWIWLHTKLNGLQIAACLTMLVGVAVGLAPGKHLDIKRPVLVAGIIFGLLAGFGNGMGAVLSRKGYAVAAQLHDNIDGATAAYQRLIGGLFVAAICLLVVKRAAIAGHARTPLPPPGSSSWLKWKRAWPWVLANGFAGQTLGVTCYQWALKSVPTGEVLVVVATTPLMVIPFSRAVEGEPIELRSILGGIIAVAGAALLIYLRT